MSFLCAPPSLHSHALSLCGGSEQPNFSITVIQGLWITESLVIQANEE